MQFVFIQVAAGKDGRFWQATGIEYLAYIFSVSGEIAAIQTHALDVYFFGLEFLRQCNDFVCGSFGVLGINE